MINEQKFNEVFNADDFLKGQKDCKEGIPHKAGKSEDYNRGYGAQYQHEQNVTHLTESNHAV